MFRLPPSLSKPAQPSVMRTPVLPPFTSAAGSGLSSGGNIRRPKRRERHPLVVLAMIALTALACAHVIHPRAYVMVAACAAVAGLGLIVPTISLRGVTGEVRYEHGRGEVGKPLMAVLRLRNRWPWPLWGLVAYGGWKIGKDEADAATLTVAWLPGWQTVEIAWPIVPRRRGVFPAQDAALACGFPFGFRNPRRKLRGRGRVIVWPRVVELPHVPLIGPGREGFREMGDGRRPGSGGEILGARPYQPGDALRRIHWRQTARHDRLIICEFSAPANLEVELWLDVGEAAHGEQSEATIEALICAAASLAKALVHCSTRVVLHSSAGPPQSAEHPGELPRLLNMLAELQPQPGAGPARRLNLAADAQLAPAAQWVLTTRAGWEALSPHMRQAPPRKLVYADELVNASFLAGDADLLAGGASSRDDARFAPADPHRLGVVWKELTSAF